MDTALLWLTLLTLLGACVSFWAGVSEEVQGKPSAWHFVSAAGLFVTSVLMAMEWVVQNVPDAMLPI